MAAIDKLLIRYFGPIESKLEDARKQYKKKDKEEVIKELIAAKREIDRLINIVGMR